MEPDVEKRLTATQALKHEVISRYTAPSICLIRTRAQWFTMDLSQYKSTKSSNSSSSEDTDTDATTPGVERRLTEITSPGIAPQGSVREVHEESRLLV